MAKKRLLSGIVPSGNLHIGNYLGAVSQWQKLTDEYETFFMIADLHAITVPQDPEKLREKTLEIARIYMAMGLTPDKCTVFVQSHVKEHLELSWILTSLATMGEMERMTQFKDKSQKGGAESASIGLFSYPILQAADILLYDSVVVPVGEDQVQHVELTRDLAKRFNKRFGDTFYLPKPLITKEGRRVMGLDDPTKKMSKSASSIWNYIALLDDLDVARKKVMKAVTDSGSEVIYSEEKPAIKNLIEIYSLLSGEGISAIEEKYRGRGYGDFKKGLADVVVEFLQEFQDKYNALSDSEVEHILRDGAIRAQEVAQRKVNDAKQKVGFWL